MPPVKFLILCYKIRNDTVSDCWTHDHAPATLEEALQVGHELTRDQVVDAFKVTRVPIELSLRTPVFCK